MTAVAKQELARVAGELRASADTILAQQPGDPVADAMVDWAERLAKAAGVVPQRHLAAVVPIR